jgi:hypothetical protein
VLITPSLGVSNWLVIYIINTAPPISQLADLIKDQRVDMLCFQETIKQDFTSMEF